MFFQGLITFYNQPRGWGFITRDDNEKAFFHVSNVIPEFLPALTPGLRVEFKMAPPLEIGKKPQAVSVRIVSTESGAGGAL